MYMLAALVVSAVVVALLIACIETFRNWNNDDE